MHGKLSEQLQFNTMIGDLRNVCRPIEYSAVVIHKAGFVLSGRFGHILSRYRLTQRLTLCSEHDSLSAIFFEGMPSALSNIIRLRFCINGLESKCSMYSNSTRCFLVSFTSVILIAVSYLGIMQKPSQHMYISF